MKQLKPGQLCTIYGKWWNPFKGTIENHTKHVYRCKKATTEYVCADCQEANRARICILHKRTPMSIPQLVGPMCLSIFGRSGHPVLVK